MAEAANIIEETVQPAVRRVVRRAKSAAAGKPAARKAAASKAAAPKRAYKRRDMVSE